MYFARVYLLLIVFATLAACVDAQTWQQDMEDRVRKLVAKHGQGTDETLKGRINTMAERDQYVRKPEYISKADPLLLQQEQERVDAELTAELRAIVKRNGWPTIKLVGLRASENAALILIHSNDHSFQRAMLPQLQKLADSGEILGSDVAMITDKILISEGKPQRYGTQIQFVNGTAEILPVEDPEHLDERRAKYLLPPVFEYKKILADQYPVTVK